MTPRRALALALFGGLCWALLFWALSAHASSYGYGSGTSQAADGGTYGKSPTPPVDL